MKRAAAASLPGLEQARDEIDQAIARARAALRELGARGRKLAAGRRARADNARAEVGRIRQVA